MCESETGLDRANILQGLSCVDCVPDLAGCKLERRKERLPRITGGKFVAMVDGESFATCVDVCEAFSYVEECPYVFSITTDALFRLLGGEFGAIQITRCTCGAAQIFCDFCCNLEFLYWNA